ncbi:MAG: hypothetical protein AAF696_06840 [Bacteroidota bacterium]
MKYLLCLLSISFLTCLGPDNRAEKKLLKEIAQKLSTEQSSPDLLSDKHKPFYFFQKEGIWDTLRSICPAMDRHSFHISDIEKASLTNIDSSIVFGYIHSIYGLSAVYPLKLLELPNSWKALIFWGEQYDSDRLTDFLAIATIDSTFDKQGEVSPISTQGDDMGESWESYSEFLNDTTFRLIKEERFDCEEDIGNSMTGEISVLNYEEMYFIKPSGKIKLIRSDTLKLLRCE